MTTRKSCTPPTSSSNLRIISRKIVGPKITFRLGLKNDSANICAVHECTLQDIHRYVSLEDLNQYENREYEQEFQQELLSAKAPKKRGRPPGIPVNTIPANFKAKGPRGRPRKKPLAPPPVDSNDEQDSASDTSSSNETRATFMKDNYLIPDSSRKRKMSQVGISSDSHTTELNAIPIIKPPVADSSKSNPLATSPDIPTAWERRMLAVTMNAKSRKGSRQRTNTPKHRVSQVPSEIQFPKAVSNEQLELQKALARPDETSEESSVLASDASGAIWTSPPRPPGIFCGKAVNAVRDCRVPSLVPRKVAREMPQKLAPSGYSEPAIIKETHPIIVDGKIISHATVTTMPIRNPLTTPKKFRNVQEPDKINHVLTTPLHPSTENARIPTLKTSPFWPSVYRQRRISMTPLYPSGTSPRKG